MTNIKLVTQTKATQMNGCINYIETRIKRIPLNDFVNKKS